MKTSILLAAGLSIAIAGFTGIAQAHERDGHRDHGRHGDRIEYRAHGRRARDHTERGCFACRVEARLDRQAKRIRRGVRSGELTRHEARKLRKRQRRLHDKAYEFAGQGFDRHERRKMKRLLDAASDDIYRKKHNQRSRSEYRYRRAYDGPYLSYMDFFFNNLH